MRDLGSKNGTFVNHQRLQAPHALSPGDNITASQLSLVFQPPSAPVPQVSIVFDRATADAAPARMVSTSLDHLSQTMVARSPRDQISEPWRKPLAAFLHAGRALSQGKPLQELFGVILDLSMEAVGAERGVLMTLERGQLAVQASRGDGFRISTTVRDRVLQDKASLLIRNMQDEEAFRSMQSIVAQRVHALMAVPLQTDEQVMGLIYVDTSHWLREFTSDDLNLLTVMANVAAVRIERERLAELEQARRRLARELEHAAEIQRQFLPARAPQVPGAQLAGFNASCRTVGGDYYDFFPYPGGSVGVVVADVSGKGMPAALLMMSLQARVQVLAEEPGSTAAIADRLNRILAAARLNDKFISFFFGLFNPSSGELRYCNAGHNPPLLIRGGGAVEWLRGGGPVLGILPEASYFESSSQLDRGDVVILFSDGVTEAGDPQGEEFGEARLEQRLRQVYAEPAENILAALTQAVKEWIAEAPTADDITLVVLKRL